MTDKWGRRFFAAGAIVLVLLGFIHSLSLLETPVPANDSEKQLMGLMTSYKFNVMGSMRSMDNFLRGFSVSFMLAMFAMGAVDLALLREGSGLLKNVALINVMWLAAMTVVGLRYFFAAPVAFLGLALCIFLVAWGKMPRSAS
jgi:hypothetical protein